MNFLRSSTSMAGGEMIDPARGIGRFWDPQNGLGSVRREA